MTHIVEVELTHDWVDIITLVVGFLGAAGTVTAALIAVRVSGRDAKDRRRLQATQVSAWIHWPKRQDDDATQPRGPQIVVTNGSAASIYEVALTWGAVQGAGEPYGMPADALPMCVAKIPPGAWALNVGQWEGGGMHLVLDAAISFRDSAGRSWRRDAKGALIPTAQPPLADLNVPLPISYQTVKPFIDAA